MWPPTRAAAAHAAQRQLAVAVLEGDRRGDAPAVEVCVADRRRPLLVPVCCGVGTRRRRILCRHQVEGLALRLLRHVRKRQELTLGQQRRARRALRRQHLAGHKLERLALWGLCTERCLAGVRRQRQSRGSSSGGCCAGRMSTLAMHAHGMSQADGVVTGAGSSPQAPLHPAGAVHPPLPPSPCRRRAAAPNASPSAECRARTVLRGQPASQQGRSWDGRLGRAGEDAGVVTEWGGQGRGRPRGRRAAGDSSGSMAPTSPCSALTAPDALFGAPESRARPRRLHAARARPGAQLRPQPWRRNGLMGARPARKFARQCAGRNKAGRRRSAFGNSPNWQPRHFM